MQRFERVSIRSVRWRRLHNKFAIRSPLRCPQQDFSSFRPVCLSFEIQDATAYADFVKMLCSVAYPRCPPSAVRGQAIAYKDTRRVCRSLCQRASQHHQRSLQNLTIADAKAIEKEVAVLLPLAKKLCLASAFYVDCDSPLYDADSTCANFASRIRPAAVFDGVAACLDRSTVRPAPPVCDAKDWLFGLAANCKFLWLDFEFRPADFVP